MVKPATPLHLPPAPVADQRLLSLLKETGRIDSVAAAAVDQALAERHVSAIDALVESGTLSEDDVARAIAEELKLPLVDLRSVPSIDDGVGIVSKSTAEHYGLVPAGLDKGALVVAMANPLDHEALLFIESSSGVRLEPVVATRSQVLGAIERLYKREASLDVLLADVSSSRNLGAVSEIPSSDMAPWDVQAITGEAELPPIVKMVNLILFEALNAHTSDVHVEPGPNLVLIRFRIDGILEEHMQMPKWVQGPIVARLKGMAKLDITEQLLPQEGHLAVRVRDRSIDVRVSSMPTTYGEKIVLRLPDRARGPRRLSELGLSRRDFATLEEVIRRREGVILCAGPTGSGKTTTLYGALQELVSPERDIVTIENAAEYALKGVTSIPIDEKGGLTFAEALRSVLGQDPDVILVGEISDRETAEAAFHAARTGRMVLSTMRANDSITAVTRLLELGIEPETLGSSLLAVAAQRLVRKVCSACAEAAEPSEEARRTLGLPSGGSIRRGHGCSTCRHTGYSGRTACFEVLRVTHAVASLITQGASDGGLRAVAEDEGMSMLLDDARTKILAGITTPSEVLRVIEVDAQNPLCPACHAAIEVSFTVCPFCRNPLHRTCARCGALLKKRWTTCPFCGTDVGTYEQSSLLPEEPARPERALGALEVPRILAVDDDPDVLELLRLTLTRSAPALHAEVASSGADALDKMKESRPHLVVLDLMMPGIDGYEVCRRLRADLSTALIPVIMLTALGDAGSKRLGFLAGTDDYLVKPFERGELLARIFRLLERTYGWTGPQPTERGQDRARGDHTAG
jgi:type IV pilus assembly protein PilB